MSNQAVDKRTTFLGWPSASVLVIVALTMGLLGLRALGAPALHPAPGVGSQASPTDGGTVPQGDLAAMLTRAARVRDYLGFPVGLQRVSNQVATADGEFSEVDELDAKGRSVSTTEFDADGNLRLAVRFDVPPSSVASLAQSAGAATASRAAAALGVATGEPNRVEVDRAFGGWAATWDRFEGGVPVLGDGAVVHVWPDGRIAAVAQTIHSLAAAPTTLLTSSQATKAALAYLQQSVGGLSAAGYTMQAPVLEWVSPNGAFEQTTPIGGEQTYRLAWVVSVKNLGTGVAYSLVTLFVDAGDGSVIGGDFVE